MRSTRVHAFLLALLALLVQLAHGQEVIAPSPAAPAPTSDGKTIDQGIAYVLLLVALGITYFFH